MKKYFQGKLENINSSLTARLKKTEKGIEVEFVDKGISKTPRWELAGYKVYFAKLKPEAKMALDKTAINYVKVLRGGLISPERSVLSPELKRSLVVKEDYIQVGKQGATVAIFTNRGEPPLRADKLSDAPLNGLKSMQLEWKHISEMIPNNPEFADKDMYYSRPQILVDGYRLNLWYAGPNVHCGIHNHAEEPIPFKEIHVNLIGTKGGMVNYSGQTKDTETGRLILIPGEEHAAFWETKEGKPVYGYHAWEAGEDGNVWAVFEDTRI